MECHPVELSLTMGYSVRPEQNAPRSYYAQWKGVEGILFLHLFLAWHKEVNIRNAGHRLSRKIELIELKHGHKINGT